MRVIVVGAGVSGLAAARALHGDGHEVIVFDKGRSVGGRLATRRMAGALVDHGAQFFTVRTPELAEQVERWRGAGLVHVWCEGFATERLGEGSTDTSGRTAGDGHPRYAATRGMNSLAKDLATGLDVRVPAMVFAVRPAAGGGWTVTLDDGTPHAADAVVVTCPLPQAFALLVEAGVELPHELVRADYDRTIALLAVLDGASAVPAPGGVQAGPLRGTIWSFVGDNQAKGVSAVPALTFHAEPGWSEQQWDAPADQVHTALLEAAHPWFGSSHVVESQVKRWRFATPRSIWPERCWVAAAGDLVLAGDAFAGPRVEGAYTSGLAAAAALTSPG